MASSLHRWESDPLFSAAEVVQDSADRMESIFRFLLHELTLVQGNNPDPKLLTSVNCHRRDLATILETTKWQLEDFERAVSLSAVTDKSQIREDVVSRNRQFIQAIREQIIHVEKSLAEVSIGNPVRNTDWINLNEEDSNGLALFLSGGSPSKSSYHYENEDSGILRRFLDPTTASNSQDDTLHNVEGKSIELENLNMNEVVCMDRNFDSMERSCNRFGEGWDLEATEAKPKGVYHENKGGEFHGRRHASGFFSNLWTAYESTFTRNYTKRLKDGEEERHSKAGTDVLDEAQGWLGTCRVRYQIWTHYIQVNRHSVRLIFLILFTLIILGMLVSKIA